MLEIRNNRHYNAFRESMLGGMVTGILDSHSFVGNITYPIPKFQYVTAGFVNFEKFIYESPADMTYHLSGYGALHNEALVSFLGEAAERYAYAAAYELIADRIVLAPYAELTERCSASNDLVCPLEYINIFKPHPKLDKDIISSENHVESDDFVVVTEDDVIRWVAMESFSDLGKKAYLPLQFVIPYIESAFINEPRLIPSAVSTGTACHETFQQSIENAAIEYMQIDSFNLWWYGALQGRSLDVSRKDYLGVLNLANVASVKTHPFNEYFDVCFTDISYDKPIDIVVCEIFGKDKTVPAYTVGVQGGLNRKQCIYRSFMEALTVLEYNFTSVWTEYEKMRDLPKKLERVGNLDDNVHWYAKYGKPPAIKHNRVTQLNEMPVAKADKVVPALQKISRYAGFLNITPPEFSQLNLEVARLVVPELMAMCLPSFPQYSHPQYRIIGGVKNNVIHPLA